MLTNWIYEPVFKGGDTRPYERFNIWHRTPDNYSNAYGINTGGRLKHLATVRAMPSKTQTEDAARLIAAAPDLLAALETLMKAEPMQHGERNGYIMGVVSSAIDEARAAIAKAKGV